jgi:hypothetical protein
VYWLELRYSECLLLISLKYRFLRFQFGLLFLAVKLEEKYTIFEEIISQYYYLHLNATIMDLEALK